MIALFTSWRLSGLQWTVGQEGCQGSGGKALEIMLSCKPQKHFWNPLRKWIALWSAQRCVVRRHVAGMSSASDGTWSFVHHIGEQGGNMTATM